MADQWFYGRGSDITGPVTGPELSGLAAGGTVLPTDTVWRDGVEEGVPADQVPDLFPAKPVAPTAAAPAGYRAMTTNARAVAGKGAMLIGQDGKTVKFRMKCTTCGKEDSSWKSIAIPHGVARAGFYCTKCRKRRDAEIYGYH
jgi:GYF domain 2